MSKPESKRLAGWPLRVRSGETLEYNDGNQTKVMTNVQNIKQVGMLRS